MKENQQIWGKWWLRGIARVQNRDTAVRNK